MTSPIFRGAALLPGLALCLVLALAALWAGDLHLVRERLHLSPLLLVILLGIAWKSLAPLPSRAAPGVAAAQRQILRWGVAGLGFRLSIPELWKLGGPALAVVVLSTAVALLFGWWAARRLGVPEKMGILLGVGGAICGASAVVAADSVVRGDRRDVPVALGVITLLGTIGIVVYPAVGRLMGMNDLVYGVWDGASLHEMAQVLAAGFGHSDEAARVATVAKLSRICLLAPVVLALGWWLRHERRATGTAKVSIVPWFLVLFVVFAGLNSLGMIGERLAAATRYADLVLLCVGMAGVGLQTGFRDLRSAGFGPIATASLQWLVLAAVSYGLAVLFLG